MSNKETKARVANAFQAMKAIGIPDNKVKPVLKALLKLYDKNWELIEEGNYRALADAIFEKEESEATDQTNKRVIAQTRDNLDEEAQATEEPERPLKRLRLRYRNGQASSNTSTDRMPITPLVTPKDEPCELPVTSVPQLNASKAIVMSPQPEPQVMTYQSLGKRKGKQPVCSTSLTICEQSGDPCQPASTNKSQQKTPLKSHPRSPSHPMKLRGRGTEAISPETPSMVKGSVPDNSCLAESLKESKGEAGILLCPERKSTTNSASLTPTNNTVMNEIPCLELSVVSSHPDTSNGGDLWGRDDMLVDSRAVPLALPYASENERSDNMKNQQKDSLNSQMIKGVCSYSQEVASSPCGEVKLTLSCQLSPGRSDFRMPSLEGVLKYVEEKCLRSSKTSNPNISAVVLMKEICKSYLKSDIDLNSQSSMHTDSTKDPVSETFGTEAGGGLTCNGVNNGQQQNNIGGVNRESETLCDENTNVQHPQVPWEIIKSIPIGFDIAKGREKVEITVVNEVNDELLPSFYYIPQNVSFQKAYLNFSLAQIADKNCCATCSGDCLSSSTPCPCTYGTRNKFAYTIDGLVRENLLKKCIFMKRNPPKPNLFVCKECPLEKAKCEDIIDPCKGHVVRKFIQECWWKCGCNKQCGNRVVQRGITSNLQVFMTPNGKGWGVRTLQDLPKGAFVCEYVGEVLTSTELFGRVSRSPEGEKYSYPVLLDADWRAEGALKEDEALCLDATNYGNVARFINHRCYDANLLEIPVQVETPDRHYYHVALFTTRKVNAMEELTRDYGIDFDDHEHPIKPFLCQCGSKFCCNIKRSSSRGSRR